MPELRVFNPPSPPSPAPNLYQRVVEFLDYFGNFRQYLIDYIGQLTSTLQETGTEPVVSIAAASTITPRTKIQVVTGSTSIQTISTAPEFGPELILLSADGFSTLTGGNILVAKAVAAGESLALFKNLVTGNWHISIG